MNGNYLTCLPDQTIKFSENIKPANCQLGVTWNKSAMNIIDTNTGGGCDVETVNRYIIVNVDFL